MFTLCWKSHGFHQCLLQSNASYEMAIGLHRKGFNKRLSCEIKLLSDSPMTRHYTIGGFGTEPWLDSDRDAVSQRYAEPMCGRRAARRRRRGGSRSIDTAPLRPFSSSPRALCTCPTKRPASPSDTRQNKENS